MQNLGSALKTGLFALTVLGGVASLSTVARANFDGTYDIKPLNYSPVGGCTDCGDVTISGDGTTSITIDILVTGTQLAIHGIAETVALNLASDPTNPTVVFNANNGTVWSTTVATSVSGSQDGFGKLNTAVNCAGAVSGNLCGTHVNFTLTSDAAMTLTANDLGNFLTMRLSDTLANGTCPNSCATGYGTITLQAVPGPIVGAGLPGLIAACGGLIALARRRRQRNA
jgi:hypothetical protein